jgi:hypothetical protein
LSSGHRVSLVFHELKDFIEVLAVPTSGLERGLAELLVELKVPAEAITWTHARLDREALVNERAVIRT